MQEENNSSQTSSGKEIPSKGLHYFLDVKVIQDRKNESVWIGQESYTENILRQFGIEDAKTIQTPVDHSTKLVKGDDDEMCVGQSLYQSAVGSLLYLSLATRPDITFTVSNVAKYCTRPTNKHWSAVKRIFRYLKGSQNYGLCYSVKLDVWASQMLTGEVTWTLVGLPQDMYFILEEQPQLGEANCKHVWRCQLQRLSMWLLPGLFKSHCGYSNFSQTYKENQQTLW